MEHDEYEKLIEFSEMTSFNFEAKEYQELRKDVKKCKDIADIFEGILDSFMQRIEAQTI